MLFCFLFFDATKVEGLAQQVWLRFSKCVTVTVWEKFIRGFNNQSVLGAMIQIRRIAQVSGNV